METGTGVVRAVTEAVRMGCDVINMSYGEAAALCDSGRYEGRFPGAVGSRDGFFRTWLLDVCPSAVGLSNRYLYL